MRDNVTATHRLLETPLKLDALQFLPETSALFPVFVLLIKYPGLIQDAGTLNARVNPAFEAIILKAMAREAAKRYSTVDEFVVRHTRMTLTGFGRFDLAYFRHTDKWSTVYRGLTVEDCFREIEENEIFWPTT